MLVSASVYSQSTRLTLKFADITYGELFREIEKQSEFRFAFSGSKLDPSAKIQINATDETLEQILNKALPTGIAYEIIDRYVVILNASEKNMLTESQRAQLQQQPAVSGRVTDSGGQPLPGVTVVVKGTTQGTVTNADGEYNITNLHEDATLVFSFVGMRTQEIEVENQTSINVTLTADAIGIEEVVAVGYGTQKKASLTGAISSVKTEDIIATKNENVTNMLAGKMSGVRIVQRTGEPGDFATNIQIRGFGAPLIIIDGVPRDNMSRLNPNEIESISVLKDASAAIYGVRAGNGVVLITTKKGEEGMMQLEYSGYYGVQTPINTPKGLNAAEYMEITNENNIMRGSVSPGTLLFPLETIEAYRSGERQGTEWWRINSNYYAPQYQHNISANGSNDMINYFVNLGTFNQEGIYTTGDLNYERYNIRSNVSSQITENLKVELLLNGMIDTKNSPYGATSTQQYWRTVWVLEPTMPAYANYNPDYMQEIFQGFNPLVTTNSDIFGYDQANQKLFQGTGNLIWDVPWIKGLQAKGSYSYDYTFWENKSLQRAYYLYQYDLGNDEYRPSYHGNTTMPGSNEVTRSTRFSKNSLLQGSLKYTNTFAEKHHVSGLVVYEEGTTNMDNFSARRYILMTSIEELLGGVAENQEGWMDGSGFRSGATPASQSGFWEIANKALIGKINYDFESKYYGEFSFRYDGSSKFAPGHQWGFFPSGSLGWRISEESFFKNSSSLSFFDNLKVRASYGVLGDDGTATFQFVPGYTYPVDAFIWPVRTFNDRAAGVMLKGEPNPNLTWMKSKIYDIGVDASLWKGLLGIEIDMFKRDREGLVGTRVSTIPDWLGQSLAQENLNKDATYGLDLSLRHRRSVNTSLGTLQYGISANASVARSKTVYQERKDDVDQWANWHNNPTDRPKNIWWGVESTGQFQDYEEIFSAPIIDNEGNAHLKPGDYKYEDWNGDGIIDGWDNHPLTYGANAQNTPMVFYGFTIDAQLKGFDFTAVFQGGYMSNVKYVGFLATPFTYEGNGPDFFYDRWHMKDPLADPRDPNTEWIPGTYPTTSQSSLAMWANTKNSTASIVRADYLRCKSLELGYTIPKAITDKIGIQGVRVFTSGYNLLTLTPLKYLDPEHPASDNGALYPLMRTINFGGSVKF
jgi:TonB-linked SusC/RagA family outer membrane protein